MGLTAKTSGNGDFNIIPEGMHQAVCYGVYDLGTHYNERFGKNSHKVLIMWEVPDVPININGVDLPSAISKRYTLSLHPKATLTKDLESWRGKSFSTDELNGFDLEKLLGVNCMLQIIHNVTERGTYANIQTIVPLYPAMEKKEPVNSLQFYTFESDMDFPDDTPSWVSDIILDAQEMKREQPATVKTGQSTLEF